jgi:hypothetical protein
MQNLCPWKVDISTNHIGAHKPFGVLSFGIRVLDVYVLSLILYVKMHFQPLCNQLLANEHS